MGLTLLEKSRLKSPWITHFDTGSCNGCDIEVLACLTPKYDVERFGIVNKGNPRHTDVFLITGPATARAKHRLKTLFDQTPDPKVIMAIGHCACSGGMYHNCYNVLGGIDKIVPVAVYVPGCAVKPEAIIDGVVQALGLLEKLMLDAKKK